MLSPMKLPSRYASITAALSGLALLLAGASQSLATPRQSVTDDLMVALQPLRPPVDAAATSWAPPLRDIARDHAKGKFAAACKGSDALRQRLMAESARLFFGASRKSADVHGIERFLDKWLRGPSPVLEIPSETFAPAARWRALAVDACVRATLPDVGLAFLAHGSGQGEAGGVRLATALLRVQKSGSWAAALPALGPDDKGTRVLLVRALAAGPKEGQRYVEQAERAASLPDEQALVAQVKKVLAGRAP
ncbi:MAG: hypothetical protein ACOYOB_00360 [Myxococcota bacterium]